MGFSSLLGEETSPSTPKRRHEPVSSPSPRASKLPDKAKSLKVLGPRGCEPCTLNKVEGVQKILPVIKGRSVAVIAQSPGPDENEEGQVLVGRAGQWWWSELRRVGIRRKDVDAFNVVSCFPADWSKGSYDNYLKMRNPTPHETKCCSVHVEKALGQLRAKQILVLGQVAAKALLKTRSLPTAKIFWSDELQAKVYLLDHPAFFIRGYGAGPRLDSFRKTLDIFASDKLMLEKGSKMSDRFAFLKSLDIRLITTRKQALEAKAELDTHRGKHRIAVDIEDGEFEDGQRRMICCGFAPTSKQAFVFVCRHKDQSPEDGGAVLSVIRSILQDEAHEFSYQYGCSDVTKLIEWEGIIPVNFTHDTNLSEYLCYSDKKAYGLEAIAEARFPEFSGYGAVIAQDMLVSRIERREIPLKNGKLKEKHFVGDLVVPDKIRLGDAGVQTNFIYSKKLVDMRLLSLETLRLYNGGDCILTKRIELSNRKGVSDSLMKLYIDASFLLYEMEPNGPLFDYEQHEKLDLIYPFRAKKQKRYLRKLAGNKKFNPGSPDQVLDVLYGTLELDYPGEGNPNSQKATLLALSKEHKFPGALLEWRKVAKVKSTYLDGYKKSADANNGRLRTRWWLSGTRTGRLSSGAGKSKQAGLVNLQNIKKDPHIQNMCVADVRWRRFYRVAAKYYKRFPTLKRYWAQLNAFESLPFDQQKGKKKPEITPEAQSEFKRFGALLEAWVHKHAPDLKTYLMFDFGQIEVRVMAQMSGDENLKADCAESDIHTRVGCIAEGALVLTDVGEIPIERVTRSMRVWDGEAFVEHEGAVFQGVREVISYDGLTATTDHKVWLSDGNEVTLGEAARSGAALAVTAAKGIGFRYSQDYVQRDTFPKIQAVGLGGMQTLQAGARDLYRCFAEWAYKWLSVCASIQRSASISAKTALSGYCGEMRESTGTLLEELRRAWYKTTFQGQSAFRSLYAPLSASFYVQGRNNRQEEQRRSLCAGKSTFGNRPSTEQKQEKQCSGTVQGAACCQGGFTGSIEARLPVSPTIRTEPTRPALQRDVARASEAVPVYDIVNAGSRHRYTVAGRLVSNCTMTGWDAERIRDDEQTRTLTKNCHFGILFGLASTGLYEFVRVMSPPDMQGRISQEQVDEAYRRYFARYKRVRRFQEKQREIAREQKYVETMFGMKQHLNVTEDRGTDVEITADEEGNVSTGAYWGNQSINGPVQGSAHQLMICALVNLIRKREKYRQLGVPPMEVHDALYMGVDVLTMFESFKLANYLLNNESLNTVKEDFPEIKWEVPIATDAKAGLRLGCKVKIKEDGAVSDFLANWFRECRKQEQQLDKDLQVVIEAQAATV